MFVLYVTVCSILSSCIWQQASDTSEVMVGMQERASLSHTLSFIFPLSTTVSDTFSTSATVEEILYKYYVLFT
jgi:hypothetical protein